MSANSRISSILGIAVAEFILDVSRDIGSDAPVPVDTLSTQAPGSGFLP